MSAKHSKLPWFVDDIAVGSIENDEGHIIAQAQQIKPLHKDMEQEERRANAAFIVKAVNFHDQLVAALSEIVKSLAESDEEGLIEHTETMMNARAALTAAGAK